MFSFTCVQCIKEQLTSCTREIIHMTTMHSLIQKAIFPVAGLGTRFLPATKVNPKEMLSIVNKPLIQYAVDEAYASGIRQMIFITCHEKHSIEDHFDTAFHLEAELLAQEKHDLLAIVKQVTPPDMECFYVRQTKPLGLGHAILCAEHLIGNESFAVCLADELMLGSPPVLKQLMDTYNEFHETILGVENVPTHYANLYGIIEGHFEQDRLLRVTRAIEKPSPEQTDSTIAITGRYIFTPSLFQHLKKVTPSINNEIQLTDGIVSLLKDEPIRAYLYTGKRYDCGNILGFLKANVALGKMHPTYGAVFSKWLADYHGH